jgi:pimeloyl-ACP methyl ester carboxylesterase
MRATLRTERGWELEAVGYVDQALPELTGAEKLKRNQVVAVNLWAFACAEKERRITRDSKLRNELEKRARAHADMAGNVADLVDRAGLEVRDGWCSACFEHTQHRRVDASFSVPTYLCEGCGAATLSCVAGRCRNMATRAFGAVRIPRYCAEHRHDLPSFERGSYRLNELSDFGDLLKFEKRNLAKGTKVALTALVVAGAMTGVGLMAAPLIGGFIGTTIGGYSGAAATSYGLALLGGGSVAAGGLGVAGGTAVVAAVGAGLGGVLGARLTNAYVSEDESFRIEKLKDGPGVAVLVCSGFLTEGKHGWGDWERIITERYPDSPVFRVHWGAEELKDLAAVVRGNLGKAAIARGVRKMALKASKHAAKKAGPIGGALIFVDLIKNPWWRARERANKTGAIVSDLIARTDLDEVVLAGHSLGARAMLCAAEALGTKSDAPKVREIHLLGAAVAADGDWSLLNSAVRQFAYNYHSRDDKVLKFFYTVAQVGEKAAGRAGMTTRFKRIKNVDVTRLVPDHSAYCRAISLK